MPRGFYALCLSLIFCALLTPARATASSPSAGFNASLKEAAALTTGKSTAARSNPLRTVVLDAGHGGKDPGGMGPNSREKHIALSIVRLLAIGIRTNFPDVEVLLTRSDDTFIPLHRRAAIANEAGADLFVSVHANIMPGSSATYGTETFVMGQHVADHNLAVAKRENAALLLEDNVEANYGYDPNSDEGHIMLSAFQHAFLERSIRFADLVEGEFAAAGRKSRGVKQAGFAVLKNTTMPAVLVECGFMSNPDEEAYLLSGKGQQELANALLKAFRTYYRAMTGAVVAAPPPPARPSAPLATPKPATNVFAREVSAALPAPVSAPTPNNAAVVGNPANWTARGAAPQPVAYARPTAYAVSRNTRTPNDVLNREVTTAPRPTVYQRAAATPDTLPGGYAFRQARAKRTPPRPRPVDFSRVSDNELTYAVQVGAISKDLPVTDPAWRSITYPLTKFRAGNLHKYQVRDLKTGAATQAVLTDIKRSGFPGAFAVITYRGRRVGPETVKYLLERAVKR